MKVFGNLGLPRFAIAALFLLGSGCGKSDSTVESGTQSTEEDAKATIHCTIDEAVQPEMESLPAFEGGQPRRLVAVEDDDGVVTSFVANELLVATEAPEDIDAIVERYGGKIIKELNPVEAGMVDIPRIVLIGLDPPEADLDELALHMAAAAEGEEMFGEAEFRFSSADAAGLFAVAFAEHAAGRKVSLGLLSAPSAIPEYTEEAPKAGGGYEDAYQWSYWQRGGSLDIGVPDAWSLLAHTGNLNNLVKIAIIDGGFEPDEDFRPYVATVVGGGSATGVPNPMGCGPGNPCPWHGTTVASAAMAIADNRYGSAGTAGPVGSPILVQTSGDLTSATSAVIKAANRNARIINMSFSGDYHWALKPVTAVFRITTAAVRSSGVLLFASAGNDGKNVNEKTCVNLFGKKICWDKRFYSPCESPGVICVGGLKEDGSRHPASNYGDQSVKIRAPYCVNVGPTPSDNGQNLLRSSCGTSYSSPFVAGIAALVWAANPSLSAGQVYSLMWLNARGSDKLRNVHAYDAVVQAMGTGFHAHIDSPADGSTLTSGVPTTLMATLNVVSSPSPQAVPVTVEWYSSNLGLLSTTEIDVPRTSQDGYNMVQSSWSGPLEEGTDVITLITRANVNPGVSDEIVVGQDMVIVTVQNPAPEGSIVQPTDGSNFCQGQGITLRAEGSDLNETLTEEAFTWLATTGTPPYVFFRDLGHGRAVIVDDLLPNDWHISLKITDSGGAQASDSIDITVLHPTHPACTDLDPTAKINAPTDGQLYMIDGYDAIGNYKEFDFKATATDPEDDDATLLVEWFSSTDGKLGEGRELTARVHMTAGVCTEPIQITLRVTDSNDNVTEDTITVTLYLVC